MNVLFFWRSLALPLVQEKILKYNVTILIFFVGVLLLSATPPALSDIYPGDTVDKLGIKIHAINKQKIGPRTNLKKIEKDYLALIKEYSKPEDIGRLYAELGNVYIQTGVSEPKTAATYLKKALEYPLDPSLKIRAFTDLGQALEAQHRGAKGDELAAARREIVKPFLQAIKFANDQQVPYEKVPFPKSAFDGTIHYTGPDQERVYAQVRREAEEMDRINKVNGMVNYKVIAEHRAAWLYAKKPYATEELKKIAWDILKDKASVDRLVDEVEQHIGARMKDERAGKLKEN